MSRPSDVDYFTPLFEIVIEAVGVIGASVFGRVWRYEQGDRGCCQASTETIGDELGLHRNTVNRYLIQLTEIGLLIDHTPGLKNRPHTYTTALESYIAAQSEGTTAQLECTDCTGSVQEERSKRQSKRELKRDLSPDGENPEDFSDLWGSSPGETSNTGEASILSFTDPLSMAAEVARRGGGNHSWTVPHEAGGADPYLDGPLTATCALLRMAPESLDAKQQTTWARELRRITESVKDGTPELFIKAVRAWNTHGPTFKGKTGAPYPNPFRKDFADDITMLMRQLLSETISEYQMITVT